MFEFGKLFSFVGRIDRTAFWTLQVILLGVAVLLGLVLVILFGEESGQLASLILFFPALATVVKRWHDRGKSGWWFLIVLLPVIGWVWSLVETGFLPGDPSINRYGAPGSGSPLARHAVLSEPEGSIRAK
jgi:uncharacterized membrane protein YhaH (DUF805 family)